MSIKNPWRFIKKINYSTNLITGYYKEKFNNIQKSYKNFINSFNKFIYNFNELQNNFNNFNSNYQKERIKNQKQYQEITKKIHSLENKLDSLKTSNDASFGKIEKTYNENYSLLKYYFFNGEEDKYANMDTDDLFKFCLINDIKIKSFSPLENKLYLETKDNITISTNDKITNLKSVFGLNSYSIPLIDDFKDFVVFDIGMNRGYLSLKFANNEYCRAVYSFEVDKKTYRLAIDNFGLNPDISYKISPHNYGLSNKNENLEIYTLPGLDGFTTAKLDLAQKLIDMSEQNQKIIIKIAEVRDAGTEILKIIEEDEINTRIILKIDTKGSELEILESIKNKGLLSKVDVIMGILHEKANLNVELKEFVNIKPKNLDNNMTEFCFIRKEYFKPIPISSE